MVIILDSRQHPWQKLWTGLAKRHNTVFLLFYSQYDAFCYRISPRKGTTAEYSIHSKPCVYIRLDRRWRVDYNAQKHNTHSFYFWLIPRYKFLYFAHYKKKNYQFSVTHRRKVRKEKTNRSTVRRTDTLSPSCVAQQRRSIPRRQVSGLKHAEQKVAYSDATTKLCEGILSFPLARCWRS